MIIRKVIKIIAFIELGIGLSTIFTLITYTLLLLSTKPINVFIFVIFSGAVSSIIGLGLFRYREWARVLIVFFSGYIVFTKIMVFAGLLRFNGEIFILVPSAIKNFISILYHSFTAIFFRLEKTKRYFING